jgi:hypothetical protein
MQYASFGSISSGTMRTEDLLEAFADELEYQRKRNKASLTVQQLHDLHKLIEEARATDPDSEDAGEIVNELTDELQAFAPPYAYFGSHPGDGADYGYWLSDDIGYCFDGLRVDDTSEVPSDYSGEVLHVNDHGNMTLYVADNGNLTEVWALV